MTADTAGSAERFTRHWVEAQPAVACYITSLILDFRDAQDLLQNVAITALRKFTEFDEGRSFVHWCLGIARFEVLQHRRKQARSRWILREELFDDLAAVCQEIHGELEARSKHLAECLESLDGRAAALIRLRYEEALKPAEMAERLGMQSGAVRVALSRIRAWLRACVEQKLKKRCA